MKNMLRAGALFAASCLLLAGCSGQGGSHKSSDLVGKGSGDSCKIEGKVPLGAVLSLTGAAGSYGESQRDGFKLAIEHMNKKGGVTYDLKIEDDGTDPRQSMTVMENMVKDRSLVFGPTLSNTAFQAQPIAQDEGVPVLAISNTANGITAQGDYVFRNSLTEAAVIPQTLKAAQDEFKVKNAVVMYSNDDEFTKSGYEVMKGALKKTGIKTLATETFSTKDTDFRSLLTKAIAEKPDALVVSALIEAAIPLVTQARELGFDGPIIGGNGFNNPQLMADAGKAAEGVIVGAAWNSASENDENKAFIDDFTKKFKHAPDQFAAQAYAAVEIVDDAVRQQCSAERDTLKASLNKVTDLKTPLGKFNFDKHRDAEHDAVVQIVRDGTFAVLR